MIKKTLTPINPKPSQNTEGEEFGYIPPPPQKSRYQQLLDHHQYLLKKRNDCRGFQIAWSSEVTH